MIVWRWSNETFDSVVAVSSTKRSRKADCSDARKVMNSPSAIRPRQPSSYDTNDADRFSRLLRSSGSRYTRRHTLGKRLMFGKYVWPCQVICCYLNSIERGGRPMKRYFWRMVLVSGVGLAALVARAGQPPDVVQSDGLYNTAMGSGALQNNAANSNTAGGFEALRFNTSGYVNTAFGSQALWSNSSGAFNSAFGSGSLVSNTAGTYNSGFGNATLGSNTIGNYNTATGAYALWWNITGSDNTASGFYALAYNTFGEGNTALGFNALIGNTQGNRNTATGYLALGGNSTGSHNTASGSEALESNTIGSENTAIGSDALEDNTEGHSNTAVGTAALFANVSGSSNLALGQSALHFNTTGQNNTAVGTNALRFNTTGSSNIAVGVYAGSKLTTGSDNIDIGNQGIAGDAATIRIGANGVQHATYVAGVLGSRVTGSALYISSTGQLGVLASSERYKTDVESMGATSGKLSRLRPVTFRLKSDREGTVQYGLIAEEVARVYPELVIRSGSGEIEGVRYEELTPMLLNQMQQQQRTIVAQARRLAAQNRRIDEEAQQLDEIRREFIRLQRRVVERSADPLQ